MGKKLNLAIIALLGFSTACSPTKKSRQSAEEPDNSLQPSQSVEVEPSIRLMYGVPTPYPVRSVYDDDLQRQSDKPQTQPADNKETDNR